MIDEKVKDFEDINFGERFKSMRKGFYSKLGKKVKKKILEKLLNRFIFSYYHLMMLKIMLS